MIGGGDRSDRFAGLSEERRRLFELLVGNASNASGVGADGVGGGGERPAGPGEPPPFSPLVRMKPGGSRPPFFCVHAVFGSVFPYHNLALHVDREQPFYALQARGLDGREPPLDRIEEMAREYVAAIRAVQPRGPYHLGGYSFGGLVAFEMAQQLVRAGETVGLTAAFGAGAPPLLPPDLVELAELGARYVEDYSRLMYNTTIPDQERLSLDFDQFRERQQPPSPLQRVAAACALAQARYAARPYAGRVVLFITREQQILCKSDPTMGWWTLCAGGVEVVPIAGNHLDVFEEPQVRDLAVKLDRFLGKEKDHGQP
jgi:thioesterase domain-containing protein